MSSWAVKLGQKAPSAKRCIKTRNYKFAPALPSGRVRKHRAPKGALRRVVAVDRNEPVLESESNERQKVH